MTNSDVKQFGKVAVLMGGWSAEREISLISGQAVLAGLIRAGVDAHGVDLQKQNYQQLKGYDRVFNMMHGRGGEDGVIQGVLEFLEMPYTGSGVLGCALSMDKIRTKEIWRAAGLPTPEFMILENANDCQIALEKIGLPMMIKPALEGSSIGITKVDDASEIDDAWQKAESCIGQVMAEKWIGGLEHTAAVLNSDVLPMIRLETPNLFYDYEAKYKSNNTQYICPCGLDEEKEKEFGRLVLLAFDSVSASGWGRVDFMLDEEQRPWLIEINTVPGMTDHSLVPMAAKAAGIDFDMLVIEILKSSLERDANA